MYPTGPSGGGKIIINYKPEIKSVEELRFKDKDKEKEEDEEEEIKWILKEEHFDLGLNSFIF